MAPGWQLLARHLKTPAGGLTGHYDLCLGSAPPFASIKLHHLSFTVVAYAVRLHVAGHDTYMTYTKAC